MCVRIGDFVRFFFDNNKSMFVDGTIDGYDGETDTWTIVEKNGTVNIIKNFSRMIIRERKSDLGEMDNTKMREPGSFWLVEYEHRPAVITISPDGDGFFACGQDALWPLTEVQKWFKRIE